MARLMLTRRSFFGERVCIGDVSIGWRHLQLPSVEHLFRCRSGRARHFLVSQEWNANQNPETQSNSNVVVCNIVDGGIGSCKLKPCFCHSLQDIFPYTWQTLLFEHYKLHPGFALWTRTPPNSKQSRETTVEGKTIVLKVA